MPFDERIVSLRSVVTRPYDPEAHWAPRVLGRFMDADEVAVRALDVVAVVESMEADLLASFPVRLP